MSRFSMNRKSSGGVVSGRNCAGCFLQCSPLSSFGFSPSCAGNLGRISGVGTDQTGGAMSGATVTVGDVERGISRAADRRRFRRVCRSEPDSGNLYRARRSQGLQNRRTLRNFAGDRQGPSRGYDTPARRAKSKNCGHRKRWPMVETTNATLGGTISNQSINDLPLNGRNYQNLLSMRPACWPEPEAAAGRRAPMVCVLKTMFTWSTGYVQRGGLLGAEHFERPGAGGRRGFYPAIDAIQEFNTEENPRAEYGWKPGGWWSTWASRRHEFASRVPLTPSAAILDSMRATFSASPGEPGCQPTCGQDSSGARTVWRHCRRSIVKDKIFFFGGYEGQRYTVGSPFAATEPGTSR